MANSHPWTDWILHPNTNWNPNPNPPTNVQTTATDHPNPHSTLNPSPQNHQRCLHHYFRRMFQQFAYYNYY